MIVEFATTKKMKSFYETITVEISFFCVNSTIKASCQVCLTVLRRSEPMDTTYPYEKLGLLYLGRELDMQSGNPSQQPMLFQNRNMTTHGVIVGMTGSGKTGLGIALLEEAIMDNIPSIIIDPKGDMGNLLLTFPQCAAEDFVPWIDPAEAAKKEMSVAQYATKTADSWQKGLAFWGQGLERISSLRSKTDMTIYTPGSSAGVPVSVLSSFLAPAAEIIHDTDTLNSLVNSTTTSLLALVDITGDPLQSREHILLSSLFLHFWRTGQDLTMEALIGHIVNPPFATVGVFPLDTFYPQGERMTLAMALNNILASPTFSTWTTGQPLDIQQLLYTENGTPRTAVFSIAHLSEAERMFFVTMLLNQFIGWMRRQQGASSLKTLLYMDEIYGYFPPVANPPSKKPMMLLLKQARAYGVGVVLATQNPVDLDYKGLANIGSWFVGRLQTRQDQDRVVEGIVSASDGQLKATGVKKLLADLKGRQFLLNSVYLDAPLLFETRWVMSYLKGPMSNSDIKKLMAAKSCRGRRNRRQTAGYRLRTGLRICRVLPVLPPSWRRVSNNSIICTMWSVSGLILHPCSAPRRRSGFSMLNAILILSGRYIGVSVSMNRGVGLNGKRQKPPLMAWLTANPSHPQTVGIIHCRLLLRS